MPRRERIFVVQKHAASRLHYDFRLEMRGVLKSWAVPKSPPRASGVKRLAVMTKDHPYAYKDFEGQIPAGQYGAGVVTIWDSGSYRVEKGSLAEGHFSFTLRGKRLKGVYALARIKDTKNWVLVKAKPRE
ncbi:MAG: DNA polymerase ligase N-terminal domain-containing protein [bacterium]|nr:DNA polymerase ligase N-terminal domain-containing protein [bacterium]